MRKAMSQPGGSFTDTEMLDWLCKRFAQEGVGFFWDKPEWDVVYDCTTFHDPRKSIAAAMKAERKKAPPSKARGTR